MMLPSLRKRRQRIGGALLTALLSLWLSVTVLPCAVAGGMEQACAEPMPCCPSDHDPAPASSCAVMQAASAQDHEGPAATERWDVMSPTSLTVYLPISPATAAPTEHTPPTPGPDPTQQHRVLLI